MRKLDIQQILSSPLTQQQQQVSPKYHHPHHNTNVSPHHVTFLSPPQTSNSSSTTPSHQHQPPSSIIHSQQYLHPPINNSTTSLQPPNSSGTVSYGGLGGYSGMPPYSPILNQHNLKPKRIKSSIERKSQKIPWELPTIKRVIRIQSAPRKYVNNSSSSSSSSSNIKYQRNINTSICSDGKIVSRRKYEQEQEFTNEYETQSYHDDDQDEDDVNNIIDDDNEYLEEEEYEEEEPEYISNYHPKHFHRNIEQDELEQQQQYELEQSQQQQYESTEDEQYEEEPEEREEDEYQQDDNISYNSNNNSNNFNNKRVINNGKKSFKNQLNNNRKIQQQQYEEENNEEEQPIIEEEEESKQSIIEEDDYTPPPPKPKKPFLKKKKPISVIPPKNNNMKKSKSNSNIEDENNLNILNNSNNSNNNININSNNINNINEELINEISFNYEGEGGGSGDEFSSSLNSSFKSTYSSRSLKSSRRRVLNRYNDTSINSNINVNNSNSNNNLNNLNNKLNKKYILKEGEDSIIVSLGNKNQPPQSKNNLKRNLITPINGNNNLFVNVNNNNNLNSSIGQNNEDEILDKCLNDPENEILNCIEFIQSEGWEDQLSGIMLIIRLAKFHSDVIDSKIHDIMPILIKLATNLRSSISKTALKCIEELYIHNSKSMDIESEMIIPILLKKTADTNKFVNINSIQALLQMIYNTNYSEKTILIVMNQISGTKNGSIRTIIARLMFECLTRRLNQNFFRMQKLIPKFYQSLAELSKEGNMDCRGWVKQSILALSSYYTGSRDDFKKFTQKHVNDKNYLDFVKIIDKN